MLAVISLDIETTFTELHPDPEPRPEPKPIRRGLKDPAKILDAHRKAAEAHAEAVQAWEAGVESRRLTESSRDALRPFKGRIACGGLRVWCTGEHIPPRNREVTIALDERAFLTSLSKAIHELEESGHRVVLSAYGGLGFDFMWLRTRALWHAQRSSEDCLRLFQWLPSESAPWKVGEKLWDPYTWLKAWTRDPRVMKGASLSEVCDFLGLCTDRGDMTMSGADVPAAWYHGERIEVLRYLEQDVVECEAVTLILGRLMGRL